MRSCRNVVRCCRAGLLSGLGRYPGASGEFRANRLSKTGAFIADGVEQVDGFDLAVPGPLFGDRHDLAHARGNQNALPHAILAHPERAFDRGMDIRRSEVALA